MSLVQHPFVVIFSLPDDGDVTFMTVVASNKTMAAATALKHLHEMGLAETKVIAVWDEDMFKELESAFQKARLKAQAVKQSP